jgi:GGDEF domain-containing protein
MASREGNEHLLRRAPLAVGELTRGVLARTTLRTGARLAAAVFGAATVVALIEAMALASQWPLLDVLAVGAVLAVPLTFLLGGSGLVRRHAEALRELAVDDLTGAWSRRAFSTDLPATVTAATNAGRPLSLALVELTNVDGAVDLFGRRRAEALIREAAATLQPQDGARPSTYRLAGEVFAVVLPGVGPDAAFDVVDGLLARLSRSAAPLSAVGGLATLDARCPDAEMLLVGASAALDEARALGPGRVAASADAGSGLRWLATPG